MNIKIVSKDLTATEAIKDYIGKKSERLVKYFGEDFDIDNRKVSTLNTAQDKSKDYVYYNNKRAGANGLSVDAMTVNKVEYNKEDALLVADITLTYSSRASSLGYSYSNMTLNYTRDNDNLILKSMFIK